MNRPKNFLVAFIGHEGSSPLLKSLQGHSRIRVPIFEELDARKLHPKFADHGIQPINVVAEMLDHVYSGYTVDEAVETIASGAKVALRDIDDLIGFKWRVFGSADKITPILRRHNVTIFHIYRRNILERICSFYFSNNCVRLVPELTDFGFSESTRHPQFQFAKLSKRDREKVTNLLRNVTFTMPLDVAQSEITLFLKKKQRLDADYMTAFENGGLDVFHLFYEDFVERKDELLGSILRSLDCEFEHVVEHNTHFKKFFPGEATSRIDNYDQLVTDSVISECVHDYERLCESRPNILESEGETH